MEKHDSHFNPRPGILVFWVIAGWLLGPAPGCGGGMTQENAAEPFVEERAAMVREIRAYGVADAATLAAMAKVRRHVFIPAEYRRLCPPYGDHPCPIGYGQTISQPFIVAYMTEKLEIRPGDKVLEIGSGSGYQAAVLAETGAAVYTVEIVPPLARHAREALTREGYAAVHCREGDGFLGWPEHAPYDAILAACAPENIPSALTDQLKEGGRMILPVGGDVQFLVMVRKKQGRIIRETDLPVRFVPMVRQADEHPK